MTATKSKLPPSSTDHWNEYNFDWLFDPDRFDHLPIEEQVKRYKCHDLRPGKLYKCAARIWGEPRSRVRRIVAPPMEPPDPLSDVEPEVIVPPNSSSLNSPVFTERRLRGGEGLESFSIGVMPEAVASYQKWLDERKALRSGLDSLGLNAEWLSRKPDKSPVELRVLQKIREEERILPGLVKEKTQKVSKVSKQRPPTSKVMPVIKYPSPEAILVIERFLYEKRLRLVDLFQDLDKDKNWRITAEEFRNAIKRNSVPLTNVQVEELLMVFSDDCTGSLNYRDLVHCLEAWRKEKKESRMAAEVDGRNLPDEGNSFASQSAPGATSSRETHNISSASCDHKNQMEDASRSNGARSKSSSTTFSSLSSSSRPSTSGFLEPPEPDLRPEKLVVSSGEAMVDLRKRNQHSLQLYALQEKRKSVKGGVVMRDLKPMIKTGDRVVDAHCAPSTIGDEKAESIDSYRQLLLREYTQLCHLCQSHQLPLTTEILQKALLYPEDKRTFGSLERIRQPADLLSKQFYKKGAREDTLSTAALSRYQSSSTGMSGGIGTASGSTTRSMPITPGDSSTAKGLATGGTDATQESGAGLLDKGSKKSGGAGLNEALAKTFRREKSLASNVPRTVRLSTGRAQVAHKVDCWMTFEEFVQLTRESRLPRRKRTNRPTKHNAYWPGQLLDKLCLVLDNDQGNSIFHKVTRNQPAYSGYNNNLRTWPINDAGYVLYGTIEK